MSNASSFCSTAVFLTSALPHWQADAKQTNMLLEYDTHPVHHIMRHLHTMLEPLAIAPANVAEPKDCPRHYCQGRQTHRE